MSTTTTKTTTLKDLRRCARKLNLFDVKGRSKRDLADRIGTELAYNPRYSAETYPMWMLREAAALIGAAKGRSKRDVYAAICYRLGQLRGVEPVKPAPATVEIDEVEADTAADIIRIEPATEQPQRIAGDCEPVDATESGWRSPRVIDSHVFTGPVTDLDHYEACGLV